jgi:signal transduction histidine kinase/DNA-binding response OmpR family regulator
MDKPIKALLIEDSAADARLLQEMLAGKSYSSFVVERADRLSTGVERLTAQEYDVVLLDLSLPDSQGLDTFARVHAQTPQLPIIVLSGLDDEAIATRAVREGAQDYLVKGTIDDRLLMRAISYAIERKRAEGEIRRWAAQSAALNAIIAAAATAPDVPSLLETALDHTMQALGLSAGAIWLDNQKALRGLPQDVTMSEVYDEMDIVNDLFAAGHVVAEDWLQVAANSPLSLIAPIMSRFGIRASLIVPIVVKDLRAGGLSVASPLPRPWPDHEIALVETIGRQLGAAAERLRLFQAEQKQRELAEALQEAAAVVSSTLDLDQVLDRILEQVERVVPGDAFNIMLVEDSSAHIARWRGYDRSAGVGESATARYSIGKFPSLLRMAQTGQPIFVPDTIADPDWVPLEGREWLRSYVAAPIRVGGLTVGFLNVNSVRPNQFDSDDARWLLAFANHAAIAIQNARLYRELLDYAEQLEQRVQERTAQLQAQYARLEAILRSASDGIVVADSRGEILQANPIVQTWLTQTLSPEDAVQLRDAVRDLAQRAHARPEAVLELTGLDLELRAAPITEPDAEEPAVVVAVHDASHLKALDRMKSRFVSNVSHELRTPITTIKLYTALMEQAPPEKLKEYVQTLKQEADRQARLIEDILQISRIDTGRLELKPRPDSLNQLAEIAIISHRALAQQRGVTMEYHPAEPELTALVDPDQVAQVLINLVTNAIQYTPEGGTVVVSTGREKAEGRDWAIVTVTDTGIGIPAEELPHIFERFFRGEKPRLMQVSGTGLGLAIAREIVELHGGQVTVESQVDVGSTFTVWLPLAD